MRERITDKEFILSCDLETTGLVPMINDWISGSFAVLDSQSLEIIREIDLESRPEIWREDAVAIHGIPFSRAMKFPDRKETLQILIDFLPPPRSFDFLCHARPENEKGFFHYDFAMIKADFFCQLSIFEFRKFFNDQDVISTYSIAKELQTEGLLPKDLKKGLSSLSEFFDIPLRHHDARSDRIAMEQILRRLMRLKNGTLRDRHPELNHGTPDLPGNKRLEESEHDGLRQDEGPVQAAFSL
jgi:DNA polymerase III alpha subunit (gram-positive type)